MSALRLVTVHGKGEVVKRLVVLTGEWLPMKKGSTREPSGYFRLVA